ncbi:DsbA family protein [Dyella flava]|uniref:DsbA family protein n=1 Tax=Dyella flava TaxID=1920170 RepID=A0ABS2JYY6_9GAMM|nr:DsbA family protein [Dyella flava]MBM7124214.1 DsbA family protein [Dyella flava]GLQ50509.1 DsbA family protein [Dyella flava]
MKLILVADPMCSWCYGFGKEVTELRQAAPGLELQVVVGGLRPDETSVMPRHQRVARLEHWNRVEAASGLPFNRQAFLANDNLVYNTEPACRAVVTVRQLAPDADQLEVLRAIQRAFYVDGQDITKGEVLADVGARALSDQGYATTPDDFLKVWQSAEAMDETRGDFLQARRWGIASFPSLLLEDGDKLYSLAPGYIDAKQLISRVRTVAGSRTDVMAPTAG